MKYVECGQQRTAIAMALLFAGGVLGVSIIVGIVIDDLLKDGRLYGGPHMAQWREP